MAHYLIMQAPEIKSESLLWGNVILFLLIKVGWQLDSVKRWTCIKSLKFHWD